MNAADASVSDRLRPFGTTIFAEMTRLAMANNAINLSQGFPDFDGPDFVKEAAIEAIRAGHAQYARTQGVPLLNQAIAKRWAEDLGIDLDPDEQVTVTSGCTEAIAASMLGLVNPGDEVVLFEPYYDSYRACVAMAGGVARCVPLRPEGSTFAFDMDELRRAVTPRTKVVLLNTPHNPTGKVFSERELLAIAGVCIERNLIVISDEVYEHLVYESDQPHVRIATLPGMFERTLTLSSLGKTFSLTGWKVGWAVGPSGLSRALRSAHQFLTFATATPLQHAAAVAITRSDDYVADLVSRFRQKRDMLLDALIALGLKVFPPAGTYFIMADFSDVYDGDDISFCRRLTEDLGVAAIPPSVFYQQKELGQRFVRFAFCKKDETLLEAIKRLQGLQAWKVRR
ncbi:MAG: aminotransferase class I/II-fold pyridoxal phosphate-dependent enzyme [Phycisphaeraceae bacterium]|nr:aminotransferase class I/II-fold pyridoxal phosphate-dependent enzyme [Phycisphaeraceae bacterium]MCW5754317.1 aminotransferase class I/II-fold pyridoxal phosphate-dependent enzyme [Phycisphaeraceae bacterium]